MGKFLTRERFGRPQILAGFLLLVFLAQCGWLLVRGTRPAEIDSSQLFRVVEGLQQWTGQSVAGTPSVERLEAGTPTPPEIDRNEGYDANHSPLWYLLASLPLLGWTGTSEAGSFYYWGWLARLPYLIFGVVLGASLWYVARRLYGNAGGYIALTLYCFSPAILRSSALYSAAPEMGAVWGAFGTVFTAIAVAHTLYAPREVVIWNWRRILLLGLSLALAIGSQFSLIILVPIVLAFMLYLAPTRRRAAFAIWLAACGVAFLAIDSFLFIPSRRFLARHATRHIFRNHLEGIPASRDVHANSGTAWPKRSGIAAGNSGNIDYIFRLAQAKIFRQHRAFADCIIIPSPRPGNAALSRLWVSTYGSAVLVRVCRRGRGRPA